MNSKVTNDLTDLRYLRFGYSRRSSGTAGTLLKAQQDINGLRLYYKASSYDPVNGFVGHESVNELIADRLFNLLGIKHVSYDLINALIVVDNKEYNTYLSVSQNFRKRRESKMAFDLFYENMRNEGEDVLSFCSRFGFIQDIYQMIVADYLIINRDRHGANIEVLYDPESKSYRLAPIFDNGFSLLFSCRNDDDITHFDPLKDYRVQCFFGSESLKKNIDLIPVENLPVLNKLKKEDKEILFDGLSSIITRKHISKIWETISERYSIYENICIERRS